MLVAVFVGSEVVFTAGNALEAILAALVDQRAVDLQAAQLWPSASARGRGVPLSLASQVVAPVGVVGFCHRWRSSCPFIAVAGSMVAFDAATALERFWQGLVAILPGDPRAGRIAILPRPRSAGARTPAKQ